MEGVDELLLMLVLLLYLSALASLDLGSADFIKVKILNELLYGLCNFL